MHPDGKEPLMNPVRRSLLFSKTSRVGRLVTVALALAWVAHGADLDLIGQWPGFPRGMPGTWR